jgi:hypothetical protein
MATSLARDLWPVAVEPVQVCRPVGHQVDGKSPKFPAGQRFFPKIA